MNEALLTVGLMLSCLGSAIVGLLVEQRIHIRTQARYDSMRSHWCSVREALPGVAKEYRP